MLMSCVRWIEALLSGRVSRVHVGGEILGIILMRSGFPMGLFLIFVNDLPAVLEDPALLFANNVRMVKYE